MGVLGPMVGHSGKVQESGDAIAVFLTGPGVKGQFGHMARLGRRVASFPYFRPPACRQRPRTARPGRRTPRDRPPDPPGGRSHRPADALPVVLEPLKQIVFGKMPDESRVGAFVQATVDEMKGHASHFS